MITDLISNISLHVIFFEITDYITYVIFYFQVSATALEETKVLVWHRDKLKLTLMETPYLFTVFEHIIARDVVRKLAQVSFQFLNFYGQKKQLNTEFDQKNSDQKRSWSDPIQRVMHQIYNWKKSVLQPFLAIFCELPI